MFQHVSRAWCVLAMASLVLMGSRADAGESDTLRDVRTAWEQAMLAGDAHAAAALFADNAVQMRPGRPTNRGPAAIEAGYADDFRGAAVSAVHMSPAATHVDNDRALEHGTFTITWTERNKDSAPVALHGRYLLWARQNTPGNWKIEVEMHTLEADVPEEQLR